MTEASQPSTAILKMKDVSQPATYQNEEWITDGAWISGIAGATVVPLCAYWYHTINALQKGINLWGFQLAENRNESILLALILVGVVMVLVELLRLTYVLLKALFRSHPS